MARHKAPLLIDWPKERRFVLARARGPLGRGGDGDGLGGGSGEKG
ncbi:MAG: hypothetical protein NZM37_08765 [Sandaracinaceae bacterium]|nr:hypothetical protein [Sandaracinaceae bacterium]